MGGYQVDGALLVRRGAADGDQAAEQENSQKKGYDPFHTCVLPP